MAFSPPPYDSLWKYFRDSTLAFVIIIGGILAAGAIAEPFRDLSDLAYPAALCIAFIPFWWFTRHCQIHDFDFYDYLALSMFSMLAAVLRDVFVGASETMVILVIAVAFGVSLSGWNRIRRSLKANISSDSGTG